VIFHLGRKQSAHPTIGVEPGRKKVEEAFLRWLIISGARDIARAILSLAATVASNYRKYPPVFGFQ
jgi:hypothetical protein